MTIQNSYHIFIGYFYKLHKNNYIYTYKQINIFKQTNAFRLFKIQMVIF